MVTYSVISYEPRHTLTFRQPKNLCVTETNFSALSRLGLTTKCHCAMDRDPFGAPSSTDFLLRTDQCAA